jgi:hypothetical protein
LGDYALVATNQVYRHCDQIRIFTVWCLKLIDFSTDLLVLHFAAQVSKSYQFFSGTSKNCVTFTGLPEKLRKIENFEGPLNYGREGE